MEGTPGSGELHELPSAPGPVAGEATATAGESTAAASPRTTPRLWAWRAGLLRQGVCLLLMGGVIALLAGIAIAIGAPESPGPGVEIRETVAVHSLVTAGVAVLVGGLGLPLLLAGWVLDMVAAPDPPSPPPLQRRASRAGAVAIAAAVILLGTMAGLVLAAMVDSAQDAFDSSRALGERMIVLAITAALFWTPPVVLGAAALVVRARALRLLRSRAGAPDSREAPPRRRPGTA